MIPAARELDRVGPYQLLKAIGAGGSARVDLARIDRAYGFQRHVVIKRPLEHLRDDGKAGESLRREARLGGRLRHPNLVSVLDAGAHDGYDYIVLEYVHGGSLRTLMQTDDPARVRDVPVEVALAIVRDVARGLHAAHELVDENGAPLGLVHRDVSPGNVLIGLDGAVKLADFGIAKETRVATLSGSMHGTVTYMAPEQCRGHAFDRRADIFSLGVILYELVTGQRLFWADNDVASLHRVLAGNVPRARKVKPSIPAALDDIVMATLAHDPLRRTPTARALLEELDAYGSGAGLVLASRYVAQWVHDLIGPRDAPWIGDQTVIDAAPVPSAADDPDTAGVPLVDIIEAEPVEEPPAATFGPTDGSTFDEIDTQPDRTGSPPAPRKNGKLAAIAIGAGLLVGGIATALVITHNDARTASTPSVAPTAVVQPDDSAPPGTPADTPATAQNAAATPASGTGSAAASSDGDTNLEVDEVAIEPTPTKHHRHHKTKVVAAPDGKQTKDVTPPPPDGKQKSPQVKWDPAMLLPTDSGSGTKRK